MSGRGGVCWIQNESVVVDAEVLKKVLEAVLTKSGGGGRSETRSKRLQRKWKELEVMRMHLHLLHVTCDVKVQTAGACETVKMRKERRHEPVTYCAM